MIERSVYRYHCAHCSAVSADGENWVIGSTAILQCRVHSPIDTMKTPVQENPYLPKEYKERMSKMIETVQENLQREPLPNEIWVCSTSRQYFHDSETTDYCCVGKLVRYVNKSINDELLKAAKTGLMTLSFVKGREGVKGMFMADIHFLHSAIENLEKAIQKCDGEQQ